MSEPSGNMLFKASPISGSMLNYQAPSRKALLSYRPGWFLLHTAAVFPLGNGRIPETMVADILREADLVGLSTSNTTDEPNILQDRIQNNACLLVRFAAEPDHAARPDDPRRARQPRGLPALEDGAEQEQAVEQMLKAYPNDRCVVFDDLGEDALAASFTVKGVTYEWKAYAMFEAVYDVLNSV
ncbi:hypothetical protein MRX96_021895 [Rhipicephalus microplus]